MNPFRSIKIAMLIKQSCSSRQFKALRISLETIYNDISCWQLHSKNTSVQIQYILHRLEKTRITHMLLMLPLSSLERFFQHIWQHDHPEVTFVTINLLSPTYQDLQQTYPYLYIQNICDTYDLHNWEERKVISPKHGFSSNDAKR